MKERIVVAIAALIFVLPTLIKGGEWGLFGICFIACGIGTTELWRMFSNKTSFPNSMQGVLIVIYLLTFSALSLIQFPNGTLENVPQIMILAPAVLILWVLSMFMINDNEKGMLFAALSTFGLIYLPTLLSTFVHLRLETDGLYWIFLALVLTWSADSGAYFAGRTLGKNKLFPRVSPNKTIEGVIGGVVLSITVAVFYTSSLLPDVSIISAAFLGGFIAIVSVVGDLVESLMKRAFDVKDSGKILPGHGGVIDRLDSLLFSFPVVYLYVQFFG